MDNKAEPLGAAVVEDIIRSTHSDVLMAIRSKLNIPITAYQIDPIDSLMDHLEMAVVVSINIP